MDLSRSRIFSFQLQNQASFMDGHEIFSKYNQQDLCTWLWNVHYFCESQQIIKIEDLSVYTKYLFNFLTIYETLLMLTVTKIMRLIQFVTESFSKFVPI